MGDEKKFYQQLDYLNEWKPELDRKAYNQAVTSALLDNLDSDQELKVLDCGTGTGAGMKRLIDDGIVKRGEIRAFDIDPPLVQDMPRVLNKYAREEGLKIEDVRYRAPDDFQLRLVGGDLDLRINGFAGSLYNLMQHGVQLEEFDLITGQAFIEHVHHGLAYPLLTTFLKPDGLIYFSMNCDGWFNYSPSSSPELDEKVIGLFNDLALNDQEFDRILGGEAFCGRNLPFRFNENNIEIKAFGPSDWVVTPYHQTQGEMNFIKYTLDFIFSQCSSPDEKARALRDKYGLHRDDVIGWYVEKLKAIEEKSIGFTCAQKDILGRKRKRGE